MPEESVKLFISYSHRDEALRRQLDKHLAPLQRQHVITAWNDREIKAGMNWANQIDDNLNKADIILLLISPDFVASDYCSNIELEQAMKRHYAGDAIIVPVVLEPCDWAWLPFAKFQAFPKDAKAITTWANQNEAFLDVAGGIRKVAQELFAQRQLKLQQKRLDRDEYQAKVEEALSLLTGGNISVADRDTLDELREKLGLTKQEADEIEAHAYKPFKDREEKLEKYKKTLLRYIDNGDYPFSDEIKRQLEIRQRDLGIKTEDIEQISRPILAEAEEEYQEQLEAEAVAQQRQLELAVETQNQLAQQQLIDAETPTSNYSARITAGDVPRVDSGSPAQPASRLNRRLIPAQNLPIQQGSSNHRSPQTPQGTRSESIEQRLVAQRHQLGDNSRRRTDAQSAAPLSKRTLIYLALAIAAFLMVIGIWLLTRPTPSPSISSSPGSNAALPTSEAPTAIQDHASAGDRILIAKESGNPENSDFEAAKDKGIAAMAAGDYQQAEAAFSEAIQKYPNAPETLIYLNNARIGSNKSYMVAVSVPITGPSPSFASEMLRGFAQAQDEVNKAGGINGVKLKLKIFDDKDDKEVVKQVAEAIVQDPNILAVMGHWSSPTSLAAAPTYAAGKIPFIAPISTTMQLSGLSPYVFRTNSSTSKGGKALADYALNRLKVKDIAVFYDSNSIAYSKELERQFSADVEQGGGKITNQFNLADSTLSITGSIKQAKEQGAELLVLLPAPTSVDKALQVVTTNGGELPVMGDMANLYSRRTLEVGGKDAVGMVLATSWHVDADPNSPFSRKSRALWKGDVNSATATSYNAAQAIITALKGEADPSRSEIEKRLHASNFSADGVSGKFTFAESGDANTSIQLVKIQPQTASRSEFRFVPIR